MDVQALTNLFTTTFSHNVNERMAAELEIRRIGNQEGMLAALMQIIANNSIDLATRQACVVWLKNRVNRAYRVDITNLKAEQQAIPASDRLAIKQNVIPLLIAAPSRAIRVQLTACVKCLVSADFPEQWPDLIDHVITLLQSDDLATVYGGLLVNLEVFKSYKYKTPKEEKALPKIIERTFPILVALGEKLTSVTTPPALSALEAAEFLHVIVKTYMTSIYSGLSKHQQGSDSIMPWGRLFFQVINMQLPAGTVLPGDKDDWEKHAWWKAKKWTYRALNRLSERYGSPTHIPQPLKKEYGSFANHFITTFAPEIFKVYLQQIELFISTQVWMSNKCLNLVFNFFAFCVKPKSTWTMLKPHAQTLVSRLVFPQLRFNEDKADMFEHDPVEYVRQTNDEFEDYASPRSAAVNFLITLATTRSKSEFMGILEFVNQVLRDSPSPENKYAALNMIVALSAVIMRNETVKPAMEAFCMNFVYPEFSSPVGYLREIACQVVGSLSAHDLEWKDAKHHEAIFMALVSALDDRELPVRVQAALSLGETIHNDDVRQALIPGIEKIMQDLFKLSDETDLDALSACMESFIEAFKDQLLPVSPLLIARLCQSYSRVLGEQAAKVGDADGDDLDVDVTKVDTDDKTFALMGISKTIMTVLACFDDDSQQPPVVDPKVLEIQELIIPIIVETLNTSVIELYDTAWELVDTITFRSRTIVPNMWPIYKMTYDLFKGSAIDYLEEMLPGLCNFIMFGKDVFAQNPDNVRMAVDIFITSLSNEHLGDQDAVNGYKLAEALLLNLKGQIDEAIPTILNATLTKLATPGAPQLQLAGLDTIICTVLYNPALALATLEQTPGGSRAFFDKWFAAMNNEKGLPRVHDKKLSILTLCELLKMDVNAVPPSLKDGWNGLVGGILAVFKELPAAEARREEMLQDFSDEEDSDAADMDEDFDEGEPSEDDADGDVFDDETAYLDMLAEESARLKAKRAKQLAKAARKAGEIVADAPADAEADDEEGSEYQESDADSDDDIAEDFGIETPIDEVDPYDYFKQTLTGLQSSNPALYQAVTTTLTVDQQTALMEVMAHEPEQEAVVPSS